MLSSASVAMAVYNGQEYLPQQIESILSQLKTDDELVISYDESRDTTLDVINKYASSDHRVKIIVNDAPGIVGNFNNAIKHCSKDVVFISDQDDVWRPNKRNRVVERLNQTKADLLIHNLVHIDKEGKIISLPLFKQYHIRKGLLRNFAKPRYSGCCMAFPRHAERFIMPMPQTVDCYDHWIGMSCEVFGKIEFMDEVLLYHRLHGENATVSTRPLGVVLSQRWNLLHELFKRRRVLFG